MNLFLRLGHQLKFSRLRFILSVFFTLLVILDFFCINLFRIFWLLIWFFLLYLWNNLLWRVNKLFDFVWQTLPRILLHRFDTQNRQFVNFAHIQGSIDRSLLGEFVVVSRVTIRICLSSPDLEEIFYAVRPLQFVQIVSISILALQNFYNVRRIVRILQYEVHYVFDVARQRFPWLSNVHQLINVVFHNQMRTGILLVNSQQFLGYKQN